MKNRFLFPVAIAAIRILSFAFTFQNVAQASPVQIQNLQQGSVKVAGRLFPMSLLKVTSPERSEPAYAQFISACPQNCPVVVISSPYDGIDWTGDPIDLQWAQQPNADQGIRVKDVFGPHYVAGKSPGRLTYRRVTPEQSASGGTPYLVNGISVLMVFNRFYRGRNLMDYVEDHRIAVEALRLLPSVDTSKVAFFGASLGGFVSFQSALRGSLKPVAMVLQMPLLDLGREVNYVYSLPQKVSVHSQRKAFAQFFDPYVRRIVDFTKGTPMQVPAAYRPFANETTAQELKIPTLVLQDEWDVVIPIESTQNFVSLNPTWTQSVWFGHDSPIDYSEFNVSHVQGKNGLTFERTEPFFSLFLERRLLPAGTHLMMPYNSSELLAAFKIFRKNQIAGKNVDWLKPRGEEMCDPNLQAYDTTRTHGILPGSTVVDFVVRKLWGEAVPSDQICRWIQTGNWP